MPLTKVLRLNYVSEEYELVRRYTRFSASFATDAPLLLGRIDRMEYCGI